VRLRQGINVKTVIEGLRPLEQTAWNHTVDDDSYVLFVSGLEERFKQWFTEVPPTLLYSQRFWQISSGILARPHEMRRQECARVVALLTSLREELSALADRLGPLPRALGVLDTNVVLHYKPLDEVPWTEVFGSSPVTLVIPRRVLAEIDAKKAVPNNQKLRRRAPCLCRVVATAGRVAVSTGPARQRVGTRAPGSLGCARVSAAVSRRSCVRVEGSRSCVRLCWGGSSRLC
jgi:hypothetical protein